MGKTDEENKNKMVSTLIAHETQRNFNTDLSITLGTIESLFKNSKFFSDEQILHLMSSTNIVLGEYLDRLNNQKKTVNKTTLREDSCICQEHLPTIWAANLDRLQIIICII